MKGKLFTVFCPEPRHCSERRFYSGGRPTLHHPGGQCPKGIVKALAHKLGAEVNVDAGWIFSATFPGQDLSQVKGLLNNPHIQLIEEDARRYPTSLYSDDSGNPMLTQVTLRDFTNHKPIKSPSMPPPAPKFVSLIPAWMRPTPISTGVTSPG